jgi:large subunit ribosomal protein L35Ae
MQGTIVSYRRGRHGQTVNQAIIKIDGVSSRDEAGKLVGKSVKWQSIKTHIPGKVASAHGNSGCLRVLFERGLPGQAITQQVQIE